MINTIMTKRLTIKDFIEKSTKTHGDYYDYSKSVYIGAKKPITIICPKHGEFQQSAANHMHRSGCFKCAEEKKVTTINYFIDICSNAHNNKYGYEKVVISNLNNCVEIKCPEHGYFLQRAASHMAGKGCSKCSGNKKLTTEAFIEKANIVHNLKYLYGNVEFMSPKSKIKITCPVHGDFLQVVSDHLAGCGCQACGGVKKVTIKDFIARGVAAHGKKYRYDGSVIDNMNKKLIINCPIHGDFSQRAADHLNGCGCPDCANGKRGQYSNEYFSNNVEQKNVDGILYLVKIKNDWCKIGITKKESVSTRFHSKHVKLIQEYNTTLKNAYDIEQEILRKFDNFRYTVNELRTKKFSGWTECFPISLLPELINEFNDRTT